MEKIIRDDDLRTSPAWMQAYGVGGSALKDSDASAEFAYPRPYDDFTASLIKHYGRDVMGFESDDDVLGFFMPRTFADVQLQRLNQPMLPDMNALIELCEGNPEVQTIELADGRSVNVAIRNGRVVVQVAPHASIPGIGFRFDLSTRLILGFDFFTANPGPEEAYYTPFASFSHTDANVDNSLFFDNYLKFHLPALLTEIVEKLEAQSVPGIVHGMRDALRDVLAN